jgi:hypothetical protein
MNIDQAKTAIDIIKNIAHQNPDVNLDNFTIEELINFLYNRGVKYLIYTRFLII